MRYSISRKMGLGFGVISSLMLILTLVVLYNLANMEPQYNFVIEHNAPVIANARQLSKLVVDMETGQRGFIITGDYEFLEPYNKAVATFSELFDKEKRLVSDNPPQVRLLERIEADIEKWQRLAAHPEIAARREVGESSVSLSSVAAMLQESPAFM